MNKNNSLFEANILPIYPEKQEKCETIIINLKQTLSLNTEYNLNI